MADVILLDGGLGQELVHRSHDAPTNLWSTQVMLDHPGLVEAVHADYFAAGATIATTNTYAIHRDRLAPVGMEHLFETLIDAALAEARAARDKAGGGRIAGSLGPLVASYRPDAHPPHDVAVPLYAEIARRLGPSVDLILAETVASLAHARAVLEGAMAAGRPVWLSVTVDDLDGTRLRSGEPAADVVPLARDLGASALLANCSAPEAMPAALAILARAGLPFGAYANGFHEITKDFLKDRPTVASLSARTDLSPEGYAATALGWVEAGATIVGGCCEIGPAHIGALARALETAGHHIVTP
jgi:S-methylmethionine-dependent homocysteine/selenocysteine methylase